MAILTMEMVQWQFVIMAMVQWQFLTMAMVQLKNMIAVVLFGVGWCDSNGGMAMA